MGQEPGGGRDGGHVSSVLAALDDQDGEGWVRLGQPGGDDASCRSACSSHLDVNL